MRHEDGRQARADARPPRGGWLAPLLFALALAAFSAMLFEHLGHPLLWQDEAETAMYATRVLEYGYPKVHGERNVVYEFGANIAQGVNERLDAFIGTTWGDFYFAVPGVLWARGAADLTSHTARLRLPFALAGTLGLGVALLAVLPAFRGRPRRAWAFSAAYLAVCAVSVSLLLHLREVRYYALLVLLIGCAVWLHLRFTAFGELGARRYAAGLLVCLLLVFNTFFTAYFSLAVLLGLDHIWLAWRRGPIGREQLEGLAWGLAPIALSAVLLVPEWLFFETFRIAGEFSSDLDLGPARVASNAGMLAAHFWRHELLAPALALRAARLLLDRLSPPEQRVGTPAERDASAFLVRFALGYAALGCVNPLVYERYFVVLSPWVSLIALLDAFALFEALPRLAPTRVRAARAAAALALAALAIATGGPRLEAVRGRLHELREPYRGPLDFVIPDLAARYANPEALVIATNYEAQPFMYYLGSHAIVGLSRNNLRAERALEPDVIVPRRRWPGGIADLRHFLARGRFEPRRYPVEDLRYNNIPALSASRWTPEPHRFETATTHDPERQLLIYERVGPRTRPIKEP